MSELTKTIPLSDIDQHMNLGICLLNKLELELQIKLPTAMRHKCMERFHDKIESWGYLTEDMLLQLEPMDLLTRMVSNLSNGEESGIPDAINLLAFWLYLGYHRSPRGAGKVTVLKVAKQLLDEGKIKSTIPEPDPKIQALLDEGKQILEEATEQALKAGDIPQKLDPKSGMMTYVPPPAPEPASKETILCSMAGCFNHAIPNYTMLVVGSKHEVPICKPCKIEQDKIPARTQPGAGEQAEADESDG